MSIEYKYLLESKEFKGLIFDRITSPDRNNYRTFVFKTEDGKEVYPVKLNTGLPLNIFKAIEKMLKKALGPN